MYITGIIYTIMIIHHGLAGFSGHFKYNSALAARLFPLIHVLKSLGVVSLRNCTVVVHRR